MSEDLWSQYKATGDREARDQLIVLFTPLVRYVASRVSAGLPQSIQQNDPVSYGLFGLIDALDKFDVRRNTKFESYAIPRIRGAIIDALRSADWVPRSVRSKARAIEQAHSSLEVSLGRLPTDDEVASQLGVTASELQKIFGQISYVGIAALDEAVSGWQDKDASTLGDTIADREREPLTEVEIEDMKRVLADTIGQLSQRERVVLTLYYYEGLTLAQVGQVLGVTESRVCQIHTKREMVASAARFLTTQIFDTRGRNLGCGVQTVRSLSN
jgi:RNA polymerase sigma factor for flagellar operon FliA